MRKILFVMLSFFLFLGIGRAVTKAPVDITKMSIYELLDAMDKGYLTSESLVQMYLERIEAYDGLFNSINHLNDKALEEARNLDSLREAGEIKGKLHGIPILVKNNIDVLGLPTNAGTKALDKNYPINNSYVVQRLVDEGAIILGSCNMSALAFSAQTSYSSFGYVKNVFDVSKSAYGSSGGSAVAVAAGFAAAALGTDTNSSVRAPSSGAGLVGIRPTYGKVSHTGILPYDFERDTVGVISRTVADNALILSVISGYDEKDATTEQSTVIEYNVNNESLKGKKIGVLTQYVKGKETENGVTGITDPIIYSLLEKSLKELEDAGAELINLDKFVKSSNLTIASNTMSGGTMCDYFNKYITGTEGPIKNFKDLANSKGSVWDLSGYLDSCGKQINNKSARDEKKATYEEYVSGYFSKYELDAMLYPTVKSRVQEYNKSSNNLIPGNSIGSVIGYPSITVSMGIAEDGMAYGIEFLGQKYNENILYDIASSYEKVNGNNLSAPILAPSLYEVPEKIINLKKLYEENLNKNISVDVNEWLDKVSLYFKTYNSIEEVEDDADNLINIYNDMNSVSNEFFLEFNDKNSIYLLILCVICFLMILRELFVIAF